MGTVNKTEKALVNLAPAYLSPIIPFPSCIMPTILATYCAFFPLFKDTKLISASSSACTSCFFF